MKPERIVMVMLSGACLLLTSGLRAEKQVYHDQIYALVNNNALTVFEIESFIADFKQKNPTSSKDQLADIRERYLKRKIEDLLILDAAKAEGFVASPEEVSYYVDERVADLRKNFKTDEDFKKALAKENLTEIDLRARISKDVVDETLRKKIINKEVVSRIATKDDEAQAYYELMNREVTLQNIFTTQRAKADEVLAKLQEGKKFDSLVKKYSESPDAENKGIMNKVKIKDLNPVLRQAVVALKEDEVSPLVEGELGYYIIRLEKSEPPAELPAMTETIIKEIKNLMFQEKLARELESWLKTLQDNAFIEIRDYLIND